MSSHCIELVACMAGSQSTAAPPLASDHCPATICCPCVRCVRHSFAVYSCVVGKNRFGSLFGWSVWVLIHISCGYPNRSGFLQDGSYLELLKYRLLLSPCCFISHGTCFVLFFSIKKCPKSGPDFGATFVFTIWTSKRVPPQWGGHIWKSRL